ncbi:unnamed protein product [Dibothriocephalus latus]|uniref:EF-hand domain-containing protein n=1 Tax=Dibothriocephalus latus TaxID=60516 RepID=A0A3P7L5C0_DIBLA|nr:unnamed protein product [Dibothriocephalus latus]
MPTGSRRTSVCTIKYRGNNWNLIVPSVFTPAGPELIAQRKKYKPARFIERVLAETSTQEERKRYPQYKATCTVRQAIIQRLEEARKDPRIHFTCPELSILLHIFFHLTNGQIRDMRKDELKDFLASNFSMTGQDLLQGLWSAARMLRYGRPSVAAAAAITAYDFILLLSCLLRGSFSERATMSFYVLDIDGDGRLRTNVEFSRFLADSFSYAQPGSSDSVYPEEYTREAVEYLASKASIGIGGGIGLTRFLQLCYANPWMVDALLPCIPRDVDNIAFQKLFTKTIMTPMHGENPGSAPSVFIKFE